MESLAEKLSRKIKEKFPFNEPLFKEQVIKFFERNLTDTLVIRFEHGLPNYGVVRNDFIVAPRCWRGNIYNWAEKNGFTVSTEKNIEKGLDLMALKL